MASYDTIWYTRCPVPTATGIAADLGWLADEFAPDGVEVRSLQDIPRQEASDFHFTHAHPGLFREGGNVPALWARSRLFPSLVSDCCLFTGSISDRVCDHDGPCRDDFALPR